jgi:hypothetical protein
MCATAVHKTNTMQLHQLWRYHIKREEKKLIICSLSEDWWLLNEKMEVVFTADLTVTMMHRAFEAACPFSCHLKPIRNASLVSKFKNPNAPNFVSTNESKHLIRN